MYRAIPRGNRILEERWNKRLMEIHKRKLKSMKPMIATHTPAQSTKHLKHNTKREKMNEDRYTEIERENRILLEKMTNIMQLRKAQHVFPPLPGIADKRSLNREQRKRELIKITQENQAILKRLQDKQGSYQVTHYNEDFRARERLLRNICEYPYSLKGMRQYSKDEENERAMTAYNEPGRVVRPRLPTGNPPVSTPMDKTSDHFNPRRILNAERKILCKTKRKLTPGEYLIELSVYNGKMFIIAVDVKNPETLLVEIPEDKASQLLESFNNDFESLIQSIDILNKKLVVLKPTAELPPIPEKK